MRKRNSKIRAQVLNFNECEINWDKKHWWESLWRKIDILSFNSLCDDIQLEVPPKDKIYEYDSETVVTIMWDHVYHEIEDWKCNRETTHT